MAPKTQKCKDKVSHAQGKQPMAESSWEEFQNNLFRDDTHKEQYEAIKHWTFIPERQVQLKE